MGDELLTPLRWTGDALELLDQRRLPHVEIWVRCETFEDVVRAIRNMTIRGAPAIGCAAAFGVALAAQGDGTLGVALDQLRATRPTAVNLFWALDRMAQVRPQTREALTREAMAIWQEDIASCRAIGMQGAALLPAAGTVLTHCNAGALATGGYGTALGIIRAARAAGKAIAVLADETRPFLQGSRLTAWELARDGIPTTVISDNMAGHFLSRGEVAAVVVGADRIARNGDTANKIGTYSLAVLARENGVPFYVAAPRSTIDRAVADGSGIPIEERNPDEVLCFTSIRVAPAGVSARHPAFDVTPARYITAIVTEVGVARAPYEQSIGALFS